MTREKLKQEVIVAKNLIKTAVKFAEKYEPESILFVRDLGNMAALIARMDSYIDEIEGSGWQPIETAPMDGTPVLVYTNNERGYISINIAKYDFSFDCPERGKENGIKVYKEIYGTMYNIQPSHWLKLPVFAALASIKE